MLVTAETCAIQTLPKPAMKDQLRTYLAQSIPMNQALSPLAHFDLVNQMVNVIDEAYNKFQNDQKVAAAYKEMTKPKAPAQSTTTSNPNTLQFSSGLRFQLSNEALTLGDRLNSLPAKHPDDKCLPAFSSHREAQLTESVAALQNKYLELDYKMKTLERRVIEFTGPDVCGQGRADDVFGKYRPEESVSQANGPNRSGKDVCGSTYTGQDVCGTGRTGPKSEANKTNNPFVFYKPSYIKRFF
jgi:hypothetical protein